MQISCPSRVQLSWILPTSDRSHLIEWQVSNTVGQFIEDYWDKWPEKTRLWYSEFSQAKKGSHFVNFRSTLKGFFWMIQTKRELSPKTCFVTPKQTALFESAPDPLWIKWLFVEQINFSFQISENCARKFDPIILSEFSDLHFLENCQIKNVQTTYSEIAYAIFKPLRPITPPL